MSDLGRFLREHVTVVHVGDPKPAVPPEPACWSCGRQDVKKRLGKQYFPHKCPHGVPCVAGTTSGAQGMNGPAVGGPCYCPACCSRARRLQSQPKGDGT